MIVQFVLNKNVFDVDKCHKGMYDPIIIIIPIELIGFEQKNHTLIQSRLRDWPDDARQPNKKCLVKVLTPAGTCT